MQYALMLLDNGEVQVRKGGITVFRTALFASMPLKGCTLTLESVGLVAKDNRGRSIWQMTHP